MEPITKEVWLPIEEQLRLMVKGYAHDGIRYDDVEYENGDTIEVDALEIIARNEFVEHNGAGPYRLTDDGLCFEDDGDETLFQLYKDLPPEPEIDQSRLQMNLRGMSAGIINALRSALVNQLAGVVAPPTVVSHAYGQIMVGLTPAMTVATRPKGKQIGAIYFDDPACEVKPIPTKKKSYHEQFDRGFQKGRK